MTKYLKYKPVWLQLLIFGSLTFGAYLSLGIISFFAVARSFDLTMEQLRQMDLHQPGIISAVKMLQGILSLVIFLLPALLFGYLSDQRPLRYLGLRQPAPAGFWWMGLLLLLVAFPFASWLNSVNQNMHLPAFMKSTEDTLRAAEANANELMTAMLDMKSMGDLLASLFLLALLPAICEELFFRGVLQRLFIRAFNRPWTGIIITAIIFSAFHGQFLGFFPRVFLGILLGLLYWYSGSIWPSVIAHFFNNALQVFFVYKDKASINEDPMIPPILIFASLSIVILLVWYMRKISDTRYCEVYDTDDDLIIPPNEGDRP